MLQKEFEERMGRSVTTEEYARADAAYMACGDDVDKDVFCKMYKDEAGLRKLVDLLSGRVSRMENLLADQRARMREAAQLLISSNPAGEEEMRAALLLFGEKEYLRVKLENDEYLTKSDRELLLKRL